jgi:serine protease
MATPHVSAVAALVWSYFPDCSPAGIRNALNQSAEDLGTPGRDTGYGYGLVQAKAAYDYMEANGCIEPPPEPPPVVEELFNGVVREGLSGDQGSEQTFVVNVPEGVSNLLVTMNGGSGDGDLYVRFGNEPTLSLFDCRPFIGGNFEQCSFDAPTAGQYFVKIVGFSSYEDTTLLATFAKPGCSTEWFAASGLPLSIPDNSATGVRASITSALEGTVGSVHLSTSIKHTFRGDLVVSLIAPSGTTHVLAKRTGGAADDLFLDMDVPAAVGGVAGGEWQLLVQDRASKDVGSLQSFDLTITPNCQ